MNRSSSRSTRLGRPNATVKGKYYPFNVIVLLSTVSRVTVTKCQSVLCALLHSIVDMNIIDLTQESDCESEDLDYDAGISEKSSNADIDLMTSSEDVSADDDSSR